MDTPHLGTLLGVWAHPDDESYLSAGLMDTARRQGGKVVVATATMGELGTSEPDRWPPHRLLRRRRIELAGALATLGVREHHLLGHPDGGCEAVPFDQGVAEVAALLQAVQPDTIVTFGPDGMTGHPDHRAVSAWTTAAWEATGRPGDLWYATLTPGFHQRWGDLNERVGLWDGEPPSTECDELAAEIVLDRPALDRKVAALRSHRTQTAGLEALVGATTYRSWWSAEWFRPAVQTGASTWSRGVRGAGRAA